MQPNFVRSRCSSSDAIAASINHLDAARALEKAGFQILRQGKHIVMTNGTQKVVIPQHNPINAHTMGGIIRSAGLTINGFRQLAYE